MNLIEILDQVRALLQSKGRVTYRLLQVQYQLSDEVLAALKDELIEGEQVATDEGGKVLVWIGRRASSVQSPESEKAQSQEAQPLTPNPQPLVVRSRDIAH